jgi:hypothetical protein
MEGVEDAAHALVECSGQQVVRDRQEPIEMRIIRVPRSARGEQTYLFLGRERTKEEVAQLLLLIHKETRWWSVERIDRICWLVQDLYKHRCIMRKEADKMVE